MTYSHFVLAFFSVLSAASTDSRTCAVATELALYYCTLGKGAPTVVIEAGMRDTSASWLDVARELAETNKIIIYDRAGNGRSSPGAFPRSSRQVAADLKALLDETSVSTPIVLVGHSIGGWHARIFTEENPERVGALVLIDSPHEAFEKLRLEALPEDERQERIDLLAESRQSLSDTIRSEYAELEKTREYFLSTTHSFDLPVIVLSAESHEWGTESIDDLLDRTWRKQQHALSEMSGCGSLLFTQNSGHNIHRDDPALVVSTIRLAISRVNQSCEPGR